jgi:hypothetical protein
MRRAVLGISALVVALAGAACSQSSTRSTRTGAIAWQACGHIQCASLPVPLDDAHPTGRKIKLALARRPANGKRIGVLVTNPGGPGASGLALVQDAAAVFSRAVLERFLGHMAIIDDVDIGRRHLDLIAAVADVVDLVNAREDIELPETLYS